MMRLGLILLCLIWIAGTSKAQGIEIRSGEHPTFSRLTMTLPAREIWQVEPTEQGARLRFEKAPFTLDPADVFSRIPRDRITQVSWDAESNALDLVFRCSCVAEAFWHDARMLVLDVRDAPDTPSSKTEPRPSQMGTSPVSFSQHYPSNAVQMALNALPEVPVEFGSAETGNPVGGSHVESNLSPEARALVLQQIGRAASQGLLTPSLNRAPLRTDESADETSTSDIAGLDDEMAQTPIEQDGLALADHINITAESSIDRDFLGSLDGQQHRAGSGCIADARIDISTWGTEASFGTQVGPLRQKLTGEFDKTDPEIAAQLARVYIFFGFGAEAVNVLGLVPDKTGDKALLLRLASMAEEGHMLPAPLPVDQLDCPSAVALWAALSYQNLPRGTPIDTDAVQRTFSGLPVHLRRLHGPGLAQRFLRRGQSDVSGKILRMIERNELARSPESELASADLFSETGESEKADKALQGVIDSNSEPSVDALVKMIDQRFAEGRDISFELAQLAGAYAYENRDTETGLVLTQAYIRALAASGAVEQSFAVFHETRSILPDVQAAELKSDLMQTLVAHSDDVVFLRHALPAAHAVSDGMLTEAEHVVADRLIDLGFVGHAEQLITGDLRPGHFAERERQVLRARVSLAQGQPRRAIVDLLGEDGDDVTFLRAQAREMAGEHKAARHLYAAVEQPGKAERQAWLASDWAGIDTKAESAFAQVAQLMSVPETEVDAAVAAAPVEVLAQNRDLLTSSEEMRDVFSALLAAKPAPDIPLE